jgi:hypothetical protein
MDNTHITSIVGQNVLYCKNCRIIEVDAYNLLCETRCQQKRIDLGEIKTIEEALWIGINLGAMGKKDGRGVAVSTSLNWELAGSPVPDTSLLRGPVGWDD